VVGAWDRKASKVLSPSLATDRYGMERKLFQRFIW
jgi:hypothetical protein